MAEGPLAGLTVVELCQNVAGPFATTILGQLGARVVKVERPGTGDDTRTWGPPFWGDESVMFATMNAGKESIVLDLDDEDDRARLRAWTDAADIVVASMRPGSLERRGLGYTDLSASNPQLIYASLSGFGEDGPLADAPGYDPIVQAFAGLMSITGHPDTEPVRVGTSVMDMGAGMWTAIGVLAALQERTRTGRGGHVTGSLFETGLAWIPYQVAGYLATDVNPGKLGSGLGMLVPYQAFATADRHIVISAGNDRLWQRLCAVLERPDLANDDTLTTNPQRVADRERVVAEIARTLVTQEAAYWEELLRRAGIPTAIVQTVAEVATHPQTLALDVYHQVDHPTIDGFTVPGLPIRLDGWRPRPTGPPPPLGATAADAPPAPSHAPKARWDDEHGRS